jgi:hypothetical protein
VPPRPTPLPSMTKTTVCKARCRSKASAEGSKAPSSRMGALSIHRAKRVMRLAGGVLFGTCAAMGGPWVLLLPTIPRSSAARVVKCLATVPVSWPGYPCVKASRMARYLRRLSRLVCSLWIGRAFQRA